MYWDFVFVVVRKLADPTLDLFVKMASKSPMGNKSSKPSPKPASAPHRDPVGTAEARRANVRGQPAPTPQRISPKARPRPNRAVASEPTEVAERRMSHSEAVAVPKYAQPTGLYPSCHWKANMLLILIDNNGLAAFEKGTAEDETVTSASAKSPLSPLCVKEECPTCMLFYGKGLNRCVACHKGICTDCLTQVAKPPPADKMRRSRDALLGAKSPSSILLSLSGEASSCPFCSCSPFYWTASKRSEYDLLREREEVKRFENEETAKLEALAEEERRRVARKVLVHEHDEEADLELALALSLTVDQPMRSADESTPVLPAQASTSHSKDLVREDRAASTALARPPDTQDKISDTM